MTYYVQENWLKDPKAEREKALKALYKTVEHNGLNYRGIAETEDQEQFESFKKLLGFEDGKFTCFWRRYLQDEENETFIHSDVEIGTYTGILFLNEPEQCYGGTAFWKYKQYGWSQHPTQRDLDFLGLKDKPELWKRLLDDGHDQDYWEMIDYAPMAFNRLIVFPSVEFHSRWPKRSFGSSVTDGRLVKVFFFTPCSKSEK